MALCSLSPPGSVRLTSDEQLVALRRDAHNALIRYATRDWPKIAPCLIGGLGGLIGELEVGVTLEEKYPGASAPSPSPP